MTQFINLTPHKIVYDDSKVRKEFEPSGEVLRLEYSDSDLRSIECINEFEVGEYYSNSLISKECSAKLIKLFKSAAANNIIYIVSNPVAKEMSDRRFIAPDTSPDYAIRGESGNIVGVKRFCMYY